MTDRSHLVTEADTCTVRTETVFWGYCSCMIATTNLQQNMDKAFERRFLYKIKFEKPTEEARASIWHSMIPELSEQNVQTLASKYDFSGGQIENISRHYAIDTILHGQSEDVLSMLIRHCDNERLDQRDTRRIGF